MLKIGIIATDLYDYYQQTIISAFKKYFRHREFVSYVFVVSHAIHFIDDSDNKDDFFSILCNSDLDVIVLLSSSLSSLIGVDGLNLLLEKLPLVPKISIGREIPSIDSIVIDGKESVNKLMDHLILKHGAKKIAFIKGPEENQDAIDRFDAYKDSLKRHCIEYDYKLISPGNFLPGDGRRGLSLILDVRKENFDAVFCCHDESAIEVIQSLHQRGYQVPNDISVVGFDNLDIASSFSPSLTTIRQPFFNIGILACKYVENINQNIVNPRVSLINTQVILRESCGCQRSVIFEESSRNLVKSFSFSKSINEAKERILEDTNFPYDIGPANSILKESVNNIAESIIYCKKNMVTTNLIECLNSVLKNTLGFNLNASFWKYVLQEFHLSIIKNSIEKNEELFIRALFSRALLMLYETEKHLHDYNLTDNRALIEYITSIGDMLLTCKSLFELKGILKRHLSNLKIKNCFIVLFSEEKGVGKLFFSRDLKNLVDEKHPDFNMSQIIPDNLGGASNMSYVVNSLKTDNRELGYLLIESGDTPNMMYNFLAEKISYGFKNISLIDRMNSYTLELEEAVKSRTIELNAAYSLIKDKSMKDALTGLYNRRFLEEVLTPKIEKLVTNKRYGVIIIDLDHFKLVNDVYGHESGDMVIKELGKILSYEIRPEDYVIRLGGEEFLLVLREFDESFLSSVVTKIRNAVKNKSFNMSNGDLVNKTCSLGAMVYPPKDPTLLNFKSAIAIIDKCLYISKNQGRDRGIVIEIDSTQFSGCDSSGDYIVNNFDRCLSTKKIKLIRCKD